jgi:hypothetical protein
VAGCVWWGMVDMADKDSQLPQLETSTIAPTLVTLTIGGNDILGAYGDTQHARKMVSVVRWRVGQTLVRLRSVLRRRSDPMIVGTVYDPSDGTSDASRWGCHRGRRSLRFLPSSTPSFVRPLPSRRHALPTSTVTSSVTDCGPGTRLKLIPGRRIGTCGSATSLSPMPGAPARCVPHSGTPSTPTDVVPSCG